MWRVDGCLEARRSGPYNKNAYFYPHMNIMESSFWQGSPKNMFFMGLFLGLAISATVGLSVVLGAVWSGKAASAGSGQVVQQAPVPNPDPTPSNQQQPPAQPVKAVDAKVDHIRGNKNAKVTLIEYSDFECPFCKTYIPSVEQALKDFPKDVRLVYRHYPLSFHQNAQKQAEASECVAKLGGDVAFWKFHDIIFTETTSNGTGFALDKLGPAAARAGVNQAAFQKCLDSGEMAAKVAADQASGNDAGVQGTPTTFVNGKEVSGAVPYAQLKAAIQAAGASN